MLADKQYPDYELQKSTAAPPKPAGGWSLRTLLDTLYEPVIGGLKLGLPPFAVVCAIICKPPRQQDHKAAWDHDQDHISKKISLQVCRDIVGNTICADFLDYLFRDWHHLGKPLTEDKRLYQYMEVRISKDRKPEAIPSFVINVGAADKIRHDALTNILELLEARYKLAETVLFHRTKLAITALLDRCLLEIKKLYHDLGIDDDDFSTAAESLLLDGSDDALPDILWKLANGATEATAATIRQRVETARRDLHGSALRPLPDTTSHPAQQDSADLLASQVQSEVAEATKTEIEIKLDFIAQLINRLRDRCVYTLAHKVKISDFQGSHDLENTRLNALIRLYRDPLNRYSFLRGIEARCSLPPGSLIMYCPPNAAMNAKVAKVNLFIEGEIKPFDVYDQKGEDSTLTRGALWAQIRRFYELWSAQVYIEHVTWDSLSPMGQKNLRAAIKEFFFQMRPDTDVSIVRQQVESSIQFVLGETAKAARLGSEEPGIDELNDFVFPSGLAFSQK